MIFNTAYSSYIAETKSTISSIISLYQRLFCVKDVFHNRFSYDAHQQHRSSQKFHNNSMFLILETILSVSCKFFSYGMFGSLHFSVSQPITLFEQNYKFLNCLIVDQKLYY